MQNAELSRPIQDAEEYEGLTESYAVLAFLSRDRDVDPGA